MNTAEMTGLTTPQSHLDAFEDFARSLKGERASVTALRRAAAERFAKLGFPGPRNEDWKFTSVRALVETSFLLPPADSATGAARYRDSVRHDGPGVTLASINGNVPFLMKESKAVPAGVLVMSLGEALEKHPDLVEPHLGQVVNWQDNSFWALNTAFHEAGAFVYVPPGVVVEEPIHLGYLVAAFNENAPYLWYRRALIVLGRTAQATVVESFVGPGLQYATNAVTEIVLADGAWLDHYKVQEESGHAFHLACTQAVVGRDANFSTHYVGLGGKLVRNEVRVRFAGENAEATVNGLYLGDEEQHTDNFTVIDHAVPHCNSHELYKGILDGKSRGVFNGKIFVRQDAQKTDAKQTNQTLLLSDDAVIDTKPQLEIFADDVKCTHGATVGQLDEQQLFYLRARGIGEEQARALLTFAFANDIVGRIKVDALHDRLEKTLLASRQLPSLAEIEDES
jgi:Fe-S cluster assembly protein SufD